LKGRKGQVAPELMLGIGIIMGLFLLISLFVVNRQIDLRERADHIEKRDECLKIANLLNSVYINGPGTEARTNSNFLITSFNSNLISIEDLKNEQSSEKIAILASESGPTKEEFYNKANNEIEPEPDWYKICFEDIGGEGCDLINVTWFDQEINNTLSDLIENLDNYTTIYLEDPHIQFSENYIELLENWTAQGNSLILSRNVMCTEQMSGEYPLSSYKCNPNGSYHSDEWQVFDVEINQRSTAWFWPYDWNVGINNSNEAFNLFPGDKLSFNNRPFVTPINAEGFDAIAIYRNETCFGVTPCLGDSTDKPAIAHWEIGEGKIYYIGEFSPEFINPPGNDFSDVLINLIDVAYNLILQSEKDSDITCAVASKTYFQQITGDFKIKNKNNVISFEDVS